jgi:hypothetical protein
VLHEPASFKDFWQIVKATAKKFDVKVKKADVAFESHVRDVLFSACDPPQGGGRMASPR